MKRKDICDTCNFFGEQPDAESLKGCEAMKAGFCNINPKKPKQLIWNDKITIERIGCASHSSARPHTSTPAPGGFIPLSFMTLHKSRLFTASDVCALIEQHRIEAAHQAREQVLDLIIAWKRKHGYWFTVNAISGEKRYHFEPDRFEEFVKSLRSQQQAGEQR